NGRAGWELLQTGEKPDLILSDFMMPLMNGGEFGRLVRESPQFRDVPFIFMSATSEDVIQRSFTDYDALVVKPFGIDVVLALVEHLMARGRQGTGVEPAGACRASLLGALRPQPLA
ncbi:MAG: response regulator, partial [Comamonadaceae bacterium]